TDVPEVTLTVQLDSDDFEISPRTRSLPVPAQGRSVSPARFEISPRHDGRSTLNATVHKDRNFIQEIRISFEVGAASPAAMHVVTRGRAASAAEAVRPRDIGLSITRSEDGYKCVAWGPVARRAQL